MGDEGYQTLNHISFSEDPSNNLTEEEKEELDIEEYSYHEYSDHDDYEPEPDECDYLLTRKIFDPDPLNFFEEKIEVTITYNYQEYKFMLYENENKTEFEQPDYIGKIKKFNGFTGRYGFDCEETTLIVEGRIKRKITTSDMIKIILLEPVDDRIS